MELMKSKRTRTRGKKIQSRTVLRMNALRCMLNYQGSISRLSSRIMNILHLRSLPFSISPRHSQTLYSSHHQKSITDLELTVLGITMIMDLEDVLSGYTIR